MSEFMAWPPYENGTFNVDDSITGLSEYWNKADHFPYLILVDNEVAGFSLVRLYSDSTDTYDMGQFFVLRKFKRKGVGERAFRITVSMHQGRWLTRVLPDNVGAKKFWLKAISDVAAGSINTTMEKYKGNEMEFIRFSV
jgi:predicted acetyltransferase